MINYSLSLREPGKKRSKRRISNCMWLTKERAIKEHRKMWNWIADQYENVTEDLIKLHDIGRLKSYYIKTSHLELADLRIDCDCFCCEYDVQFYGDCRHCPLEWGGCARIPCIKTNDGSAGLYESIDMLTDAYSCENDFVLCGKIANLPERKLAKEVM